MKRRLFNLAAALSLLLCAAACVLWARSLGHVEGGLWARGSHELSYYSWSGCFGADGTMGDGPSRPENSGLQHLRRDTGRRYSIANSPVTSGPGRWGFGFHIGQSVKGGWLRGGYPIVSIYAPYWFLVILFGVPPPLWFRRRLCGA